MNILKRAVICLSLLMCCAGYVAAQALGPYVLTVGSKPYLMRSYLMFEGKKRTHVISVGNPAQLNYSYDLKTGALLQVWRGAFLDVTEMWKDRGEPQLAKPLGTVLVLSSAPAVAELAGKDTAWPDSIGFDALQNKGYTLDKNKMPVFEYTIGDATVKDQISVAGDAFERTISLSGNKQLYCRIASGKSIVNQNGAYSVDAGRYAVKVGGDAKAFIRPSKDGQELLVLLGKNNPSVRYSLNW